MTYLVEARSITALRRAAVRATYASSIHNAQPWQFVLQAGELRIHADRSRQLPTSDPVSRQLTISCGCALMNARVSIAASGLGVRVQRLPDGARSNLVARITTTDEQNMPLGFSTLDGVLELRETNRRRFADDRVPAEVVAVLEAAAAAESSTLFVVWRADHRLAIANLGREADALWTTNNALRHDDQRPQCLLVLGTAHDQPLDWLRAGEALERILLELTWHGFVADDPLTQAIETPSIRADLREQLGLNMHPQVVVRIGRAPLTPAARRRRLVDVLVEKN